MNEYELYLQKIEELKNMGIYPIEYGKSTLNLPLYVYKLSKRVDYHKRPYKVLVQAGIHAREFITTFLVFSLIEKCNKSIHRELSMYSSECKNLLVNSNYELYFVPNSNIDGFRLCVEGVDFIKEQKRKDMLLNINQGNFDFSLFKANANGVDLNVNFDANWGGGAKNIKYLNFENYIGKFPNSEVETRALIDLVKKIEPDLTISYHSKGEEIYYGFVGQNESIARDEKLAKIISKTTKYSMKNISNISSGGFKDYCISKFNIPSFTIEVGDDKFSHPLGLDKLPKIYKENRYVLQNLLKYIFVESQR